MSLAVLYKTYQKYCVAFSPAYAIKSSVFLKFIKVNVIENTLMGFIRIFLIKYCISSRDPKNNFDINGKYPINEN